MIGRVGGRCFGNFSRVVQYSADDMQQGRQLGTRKSSSVVTFTAAARCPEGRGRSRLYCRARQGKSVYVHLDIPVPPYRLQIAFEIFNTGVRSPPGLHRSHPQGSPVTRGLKFQALNYSPATMKYRPTTIESTKLVSLFGTVRQALDEW